MGIRSVYLLTFFTLYTFVGLMYYDMIHMKDKHEEVVASEESQLNVPDSTLGEMSNILNDNTQIKANL